MTAAPQSQGVPAMTLPTTPTREEVSLKKHFETIEDLLRTVDGHDLTNWFEDDNGNQTGLEEGYVDATGAFKAFDAIKSENARLAERVRVLEGELKKIRSVIPMNFLIAHDTPGATGPTDALDLVGAIRSLVHNARKWEDRARSALSQKDGEAPKQ